MSILFADGEQHLFTASSFIRSHFAGLSELLKVKNLVYTNFSQFWFIECIRSCMCLFWLIGKQHLS